MVKYKFTKEGTTLFIVDCYEVPKAKYQRNLNAIRSIHGNQPVMRRSDKSIMREWAALSLMYRLGIQRERTANAFFTLEQSTMEKIWCYIFGSIGLLFLK